MNTYSVKYNMYPLLRKRIWSLLLFFSFSVYIIPCGLAANEIDSLEVFDKTVSYQSELSNLEQIAITKKAESYALSKGNVYKALDYACKRVQLYFSSDYIDSCEQLYTQLIPKVEEQLALYDEEEWKVLLIDCYSHKALNLMYSGKSDSALQIYRMLLKRFEDEVSPLIQAKCLNGMGIVFANSKLYDWAREYLEKSLQQFDLADNQRGIFGVCSNLVAFFDTQGLFEEALPYGLRAYHIAHDEHYNGQSLIYASLIMGSLYSGMEKYNLADTYYAEAYNLSREKNLTHLEGFCGVDYAKNLFNMQLYDEARNVAENTLGLIVERKKFSLQADLLMTLSDIAEKQNDSKASLRYLRQYLQIRDSLNELDNARQLIYSGVQYSQQQQKEREKMKQEAFDLVARQAKSREIWIIVLSVVCIVLVGAVVTVVLLLMQSRRRMRLLSQETRRQIEEAESRVVEKDKELTADALRFLRLNNIQESIQKDIKTLKTTFILRGKEKSLICNIEETVKQISSEKEWKDFLFYFGNVDSEFLNKLTNRYPDLNANEKHLCVLFKLGLSNRDVANLTGRTLQSVNMAKFRMKGKFGLTGNEELSVFLRDL